LDKLRLNLLIHSFIYLTRLLWDTSCSNRQSNIHIVLFQFVKNSYFKFLQGSVETQFRWSWKFNVLCVVANLCKTMRINFYQNRSSIV